MGVGELTSVKEKDQPLQIEIYPNPTIGLLYINTGPLKWRGNLLIYDSQGKLVYQGLYDHENNEVIELNLNWLQEGIYLLRLNTAGGEYAVKKFVIAK